MSKSEQIKKKIDRLDYIKVRNFFSSKDTTQEMNGKTQTGKILAKHIANRGLVCGIYEVLQLNNRMLSHSIKYG